MAKKCICFGRVSSTRQDFTAQINTVKKTALNDGYKESEIAIVQGKESAIKKTEEERQTLNEMKQLIEENPSIESVYCFAIDRLARRVSIILSIRDYLLARNINLVFLTPMKMETMRRDEKTGELVENEMTKLLLMLLSYGAEMEMKIKTERAVNKKEEMKENNEVIGKLILGYRNNKRKAEIDPNKGAIVKWIFNTYNQGDTSLTQLFNKGVELGYWNNLASNTAKATKIRQILKNYAYCGEPTQSGFTYPKLVEKEEIDKAIELMKEACNKPKTQSKVIALAKGKIKDAKSGYTLLYDGNHLKYCVKDRAKKIQSASLNIVDFLVWREASRIKWNILLNKDDNTKIEVGKELDQITDGINNLQNIIDTEIEPKFERLYKAYINTNRISDEDYNKGVKELEKEENKYKKQIESLKQKQVELQAILTDLANNDNDINPHEVMNITDYQHQKEITDETIELITVERTELGQEIKIYNKIESEPQIYINKTKTNHTAIYQVLNKDNEALDISDEYKPRYIRKNR